MKLVIVPAALAELQDAAAYYAAQVRSQEQHFAQLGIHAVPSVIVNDRHLIQGGQPPEVFEQALRRIAEAG